MLEKRPEEISLMDVINCTESTMAISRCLEKDGYCSRNYSDCCKVHKVLLDWDMVSLLVAVLNHNNLVETEHQDDISFYTEQVYRQLQKNYPEYGITEEEIENVSHLAPIHDIGKIRVSIEILNKNGKLTIDEMEVVKQHPICRKKKKTWYDSKTAC